MMLFWLVIGEDRSSASSCILVPSCTCATPNYAPVSFAEPWHRRGATSLSRPGADFVAGSYSSSPLLVTVFIPLAPPPLSLPGLCAQPDSFVFLSRLPRRSSLFLVFLGMGAPIRPSSNCLWRLYTIYVYDCPHSLVSQFLTRAPRDKRGLPPRLFPVPNGLTPSTSM